MKQGDYLESEVRRTLNNLQRYPVNLGGVVPESTLNMPGYKEAKEEFNNAYDEDRKFNSVLLKNTKGTENE